MGPNIIFDKSLLHSLNIDESFWLETFFTTNLTPIFLIETLADLKREIIKGRTPEDIVGNLALKTPDDSHINTFHRTLMEGELKGHSLIDMLTGRPIISGGRDTNEDGKRGAVFEISPEEIALNRWEKHEFVALERDQAKNWRDNLTQISPTDQKLKFLGWYGSNKPNDLKIVKSYVDNFIDGENRKSALSHGLSLLNVNPDYQSKILNRWEEEGSPTLVHFAPYFRFVYSIDLFFYLARAADLISDRLTNIIDIAYLYYLPFCMVFSSSDKLHRKIVPLFMRDDQTFIWGLDLKKELSCINQYYSKFPESEKEKGVNVFAPCPPDDTTFLITRIWDKYMIKGWRSSLKKSSNNDNNSEFIQDLLEKINKDKNAKQISEKEFNQNPDELNYIITQHKVHKKKGTWYRIPKHLKN